MTTEHLPLELADRDVENWADQVANVPPEHLLAAIIALSRELLEEWNSARPADKRPERALDAANALLKKDRTENAVQHARAVAKACTQARKDSLGYQHRIAEAARCVAIAAAAKPKSRERFAAMREALEKVEEHRVYRLSVEGIYDKERAVRLSMIESLNQALDQQG